MIQFLNRQAQDPILTRESDENRVKIPKLILNQEIELNCQVEVQDHIHAQVQFWKRITCQNINGSQNSDFCQVQIGMLKLNFDF